MKTYKNLSALENAIQKAVGAALMSSGVIEEIKREIKAQEEAYVYGSYTPEYYERRYSLGSQFQVEKTGVCSVRVWDTAPPNYSVFSTPYPGPPGLFAQWINDGRVPNVFNEKSYPWMSARPFYRAAEAALVHSAVLKSAIIKGIKSRI